MPTATYLVKLPATPGIAPAARDRDPEMEVATWQLPGPVNGSSGVYTADPQPAFASSPARVEDTGVGTTELRCEFQRLAANWRRETRHLSMEYAKAMHPDYQRIIGMGERALAFILEELQQRLDHWFWALTVIARETPVPEDEAGKQRLMQARWLDWGRRKGYIE